MNQTETQRVDMQQGESAVPFNALILFTFVIYIAPQIYFPFLRPLRLAMVSAVLAATAYIFSRLSRGQPLFKVDPETRLLLIIVLLALASIPFSRWPGGSFQVLMDQYIKVIIISILIGHVLTSIDRLKKMLWSIMYFSTFISYSAIKNYLSGNFYFSDRIRGVYAPIATNPNDLALTLILTIPFALSFFSTSKGLRKGFCGAYVILATFAVICTFSRGGFVVLVIVYAIFFKKMVRKNGVKAIFMGVILAGLFLAVMPQGYSERLSSIIDFSKDETGSADARKASTLTSVEIILERPLLGVGLGMNQLALNDRGFFWTSVHNVYLQIGVELGIPAMILFVVLLFRLIKGMRKIQKDSQALSDGDEVASLAQAIEISLKGFTIAAFFHPVAYHFYFYYLAGYAVALNTIVTTRSLGTRTPETALGHGF